MVQAPAGAYCSTFMKKRLAPLGCTPHPKAPTLNEKGFGNIIPNVMGRPGFGATLTGAEHSEEKPVLSLGDLGDGKTRPFSRGLPGFEAVFTL